GLLGLLVELQGVEAVPLHRSRAEGDALQRKRPEAPLDLGQGRAQRDQRAQDHVPARAADQIEVDDAHDPLPERDRSAMTPAAYPAPNPLSMLTTVTPAAHELSIARSAARPPNDAPYPMLVGTAITGRPVMPPTTLARAPSMPATTTTAEAFRSAGTWRRMRWIPATPASYTRPTGTPMNSRVTAASSATGRSAVPALTTRTFPGRVRRRPRAP